MSPADDVSASSARFTVARINSRLVRWSSSNRRSPWRRFAPNLRTALALSLFGGALYLLHRQVAAYRPEDVREALTALSWQRIIAALGLTGASYALLMFYDALALRHKRKTLRLGEALARADAQREKLTSQLNELEAAERVLRATARARRRERCPHQNADHSEGGGSSETTRAPAQCDRKISYRQPPLAEPQRSGSCPGNWQDAARNHRCMQRRSPEPCRRRDCPTQAGRPRRRARWEALCHTAERDGATRRGLRRDKKSAGRLRKEPVVVFASLRCSVDRASPSARHKG
jgi:hypothetical protein